MRAPPRKKRHGRGVYLRWLPRPRARGNPPAMRDWVPPGREVYLRWDSLLVLALNITVLTHARQGKAAEASASKPPRREGPPPYKGGALVQGVQRPISLEYQIKPPSHNI